MKEVIYALGAQLAYYNWHNYDLSEKDMYEILSDTFAMDKLTQGKDQKFIDDNTSYELALSDGKRVTIYKEEDKRLLMMYSEDRDRPDLNPLFKDIFEGWSFIEGMNHEKAYNETKTNIVKNSDGFWSKILELEFSYAGLSKENSGFQGFAMENGNDILISYRGTDFETELKEDMINTNRNIFFGSIPDQVLCAIYFYEKIKNMNPNKKIHITGHSLGGGLAQFVALYGGNDIKKTVTWNGLGIRNLYETSKLKNLNLKSLESMVPTRSKVGESSAQLNNETLLRVEFSRNLSIKTVGEYLDLINKDHKQDNLYRRFLFPVVTLSAPKPNLQINLLKDREQNPCNEYLKMVIIMRINENYNKLNDKLINYYLSGDIVKKLSSKTGRSICVDDSSQSSNDGGFVKVVSTGLNGGNMDWHGINNFLPFMDNGGNIRPEELRENYMKNFVKMLFCGTTNEIQDIYGYKIEEYDFHGETKYRSKKDVISPSLEVYESLQEFSLDKNDEPLKKILDKIVPPYIFGLKYLLNNNLRDTLKSKGKENAYYINIKDEKYEYIFGEFNNYALIGGVLGQEEAKLYKYQILHYKKQSQD